VIEFYTDTTDNRYRTAYRTTR